MGKKKFKINNWSVRGRAGDVIEITIRDTSGQKIEAFKFNYADEKARNNALTTLNIKYGFKFNLKKINPDKDLDWLNDFPSRE